MIFFYYKKERQRQINSMKKEENKQILELNEFVKNNCSIFLFYNFFN
ncbi:unknown protein [Mesoplasma florum L1]|uniref:Uncharacterized protein n=1 Tax=Mesoplasma florum (strain ATCC 33453 / NBRC 100688 / NCTC 11704 / L1) TaxID=265311 RepID=Q6F1C1_MESFL|nr:unknown protein [Mesoplasma florum L1]AGY41431.1 hypothetical protein mflW37_3640 [Mesoplasma florum W37]